MSFIQEIENIEDHRVDANKDYELADIIFLTIAAVLCGAKGWKAIKIFGETQLDGLREYRNFSNGIPTRHSIGRIIRGIKAESLVTSFVSFSNNLRNKDNKEQITFDAMGCQTVVAEKVIEQGGDFLLALKGNQGEFHQDVSLYLDELIDKPSKQSFDYFENVHGDHRRIEVRKTWLTNEID